LLQRTGAAHNIDYNAVVGIALSALVSTGLFEAYVMIDHVDVQKPSQWLRETILYAAQVLALKGERRRLESF
jgi:hypothetical protein